MQYTKRVRINTGLRCNVKCRFCYYWDKLDLDNPSIGHIKYLLKIAKSSGIEHIDFSGGESSIRPDFKEILGYAKKIGFKTRCTLTNGQLFVNKDFLKRLADSGLNEVLFSVHGCNPEEHDWLTQVPGSFNRMMKAIDNLKELGIQYRFNVTVTKKNFKSLKKHAKLFVNKKPLQVNFILFNYWGSADKTAKDMSLRYSEASPFLKEAIDIMKKDIKYINVRYIPMCFMKDYENHVTNHGQKIFDPFEWNPIAMSRTQGGIKRHYARLIYFFFRCFPLNSTFGLKLSIGQRILLAADKVRGYTHPKICKKCKNYLICDGPERQYVESFGFNDLKPYSGKRIKDPLYYRKDFYKGLDKRFL